MLTRLKRTRRTLSACRMFGVSWRQFHPIGSTAFERCASLTPSSFQRGRSSAATTARSPSTREAAHPNRLLLLSYPNSLLVHSALTHASGIATRRRRLIVSASSSSRLLTSFCLRSHPAKGHSVIALRFRSAQPRTQMKSPNPNEKCQRVNGRFVSLATGRVVRGRLEKRKSKKLLPLSVRSDLQCGPETPTFFRLSRC